MSLNNQNKIITILQINMCKIILYNYTEKEFILLIMEIDEKMKLYKSQELNKYTEQCDLLKMLSIPTFGIYSNDYAFLEQILIQKGNSLSNNSPKIVHEQINYLNKKYPYLEINYFHLTLSASTLFLISPENINHLSYTPLNFISHPYIFYNCQLNREHKSDVYCAAYIDNNEIDTIKEEKGDTHLRVNPECNIDDSQLKREVYIHLSGDGYPSISPNNCHLLINLNAQIINFYVITLGTFGGKIVKCFVGNYLVIPNLSNLILYKNIYLSFLKQKNSKEDLVEDLILFKSKFNDIFEFNLKICVYDLINNIYDFDIVKNKIINSFRLIFEFGFGDINDHEEKKRIENISNYYFNNLINFIGNLYIDGNKVSPDFGEKILVNSIKMNYFIELILKYIDYFKSRINNIFFGMIYFMINNEEILFYLKNKAEERYIKEQLPNIKRICAKKADLEEKTFDTILYSFPKLKIKSNPNIELLINICNHINKNEDFNINDLDDIYKTYLFFIVWEYKGKLTGIHNDFGRVSFMRINEIDPKYFCTNEDRIKCCQELIQRLIDADEKNY